MTTYPLDKLSYFLCQDSASEVSYLWKNNIMNMKMKIWTKWQISVLAKIHIPLPFYLILTRGPIIIVKRNLRVILSWWMLLRWLLGVCSIRVLAKNHGNPYYEPTIVVHDECVYVYCMYIYIFLFVPMCVMIWL